MVNYRRNRVAGGTFFFTVNLFDRRKTILLDHVDLLRRIVIDVKTKLPFVIRDDRDFEAHVNYVHINPVNHGYVARAIDWLHSTIHRDVKRGMLAKDWACVPNNGDFGER